MSLFEVTFRLLMLGDGTDEILPTPVVIPNDALFFCAYTLHFECVPRFLLADFQSLPVHVFFLFCRDHIVDLPVLQSYVATFHLGRSM
jgi:hypothetical protein